MFDKINFEGDLRDSFINLIAKYTGLKIRESEISLLVQNIDLRMKALKLTALREYYNLLAKSDEKSNQEWITLISNLTNTESYFFRDKGQFNLLRNMIIPNLMKSNNQTRNIRIWSAGCSSGEEVYSLAMLIKEIIPDLDLWNIQIFGTDINQNALAKARKGIYSTWSFRMVDQDTITNNFKIINNQYQVNSEVKKIVNFGQLNLVKDHFPSDNSLINNMDLIICRNVFIYFQPRAIAKVLDKFYQTLKPSGYLMTGHAELSGQDLRKYKTHIFPESLLYQKDTSINLDNLPLSLVTPLNSLTLETETNPLSLINIEEKTEPIGLPNVNIPIINPLPGDNNNLIKNINLNPLTPKSPQPLQVNKNNDNNHKSNNPKIITPSSVNQNQDEDLLTQAEKLFQQKQYNLAIEKVKEYLKKHTKSFPAYYLIAKIYANIGQHEEASKYCHQALKINEFAAEPYYLLAKISEDTGKLNECKQLLKKIIYLDANFIPAYLDLAVLYEQEGDTKRAQKMKETALQLLTKLNPKNRLEHIEYATVSELIEQLKKALS